MPDLNIYLLRHGETEFSKTGGFCGFLDAELSVDGKLMAEQFANAHQSIDWSAIYCSSLTRTVETASPLARLKQIELQKRDGLKEINYGAWEGLTHEIVLKKFPDDYHKWVSEPGWNAPTNGETAFQIAERAMNVLSEIMQKHSSGNVLVVSHKATIRIIICSLLGIELGRYRDRVNALAGSLAHIKLAEHGPMLELINDRSYMSPELRNKPGT